MSPVLSALPVAAAVLFSTTPTPPAREVDDVAAFARLYGVVRFFYPSDPAAELDWNRFAVHGVARVRAARDSSELEAALRQLVAPLGPGLEIGASLPPAAAAGAPGEPLVAWRYLGPGISTMGGPHQAKRTHRAATRPTGGFVTLMQTVPAAPLRGKALRLSAQARARASEGPGGGALWLRVDRPNQAVGFFDNMGDRPIREPDWRPYAVEGTVVDDAENVAFGVMAMGAVTADFDTVALAVKDATGDWAPVAIQDAGFEAAEGEKSGWLRTGSMDAAISRLADGAPQGGRYLRFAPPPSGPAETELFPEGARSSGAHADVDLESGLRARVPLALTDAQARPDPARQKELDALRAALAAVAGPGSTPEVDQRLADVVVSSARPSEAPVGAVVSTIDGLPATDRLARAVSLASGTTQWRQVAGIGPLMSGPAGTTVRLGLDTGSGAREVDLAFGTPPPPAQRPGPVVEKEPGVWYVDLTRAKMAEIAPKLDALAAARAVVFDVRGYPTDAGFGILPHLLDVPEADRWMHVAKIVGPFYETAGWQDVGWDVKPASPRIAGKVVFRRRAASPSTSRACGSPATTASRRTTSSE